MWWSSRALAGCRRFLRRIANSTAPEPLLAPPGFDWQWYVRSYTDLAAAGIVDEQGAIRHWRQYGCREGRRCRPRRPNGFDWLTYVDHFAEEPAAAADDRRISARLICPSVDSIFLRAWGDLVCWDDAGSEHVLQEWDEGQDYAQVFLSREYEHIRASNQRGEMPWPETCERCLLLRVLPASSAGVWDRRTIRILRVEPSYHCSLACPGCVPISVRRQHTRAFQLDPKILERLLGDLARGSFTVGALDFQGHGEPLRNPRVWDMARRAREQLRDTWITMTTSAQGIFHREMAQAGFDEIVCAIDGVNQETYAPYRVNGSFDMAWRFMTGLIEAAASQSPGTRVVWKYILFEHNASRDVLVRAQELARQVGVAELVFVLTRNGPAPTHILSPADVPLLAGGPPLSFRFHEPSIVDLEARLERARALIEAGSREDGERLLRSIRRNLDRFYPQGVVVPDRQRRLIEAIES